MFSISSIAVGAYTSPPMTAEELTAEQCSQSAGKLNQTVNHINLQLHTLKCGFINVLVSTFIYL